MEWSRDWPFPGRILADATGRWLAPLVVQPPGGPVLVVRGCADGSLWVHDWSTGAAVTGPLPGHRGPLWLIAAAQWPDGREVIVTAGDAGPSGPASGEVLVRDLETGRPVPVPARPWHDRISALAVARGRQGELLGLAGGYDGTVQVWDLVTGRAVRRFVDGHRQRVTRLAGAVLPDGRPVVVSASADGTVQSWDLDGGVPLGAPGSAHPDAVTALVTGDLGRGHVVAVSGSSDGTIRIWDVATGASAGVPEPPAVACGALAWVEGPAISNGRPLLVVADDRVLRIWDLVAGDWNGPALSAHTGPIERVCVTLLPDERVLAVSAAGNDDVWAWELAAGSPPVPDSPEPESLEPESLESESSPFTRHQGLVRGVCLTTLPGGRPVAVTAGQDTTVRVWDVTTGEQVGDPMIGHREPVTDVATIRRPDGGPVVVSISGDHTVRVWDVATGGPFGSTVIGFIGWLRSVALAILDSGHPVVVLSQENMRIELWGIARRRLRGEPAHIQFEWLTQVAVSTRPGGRTLVLTLNSDGDGGQLDVWDVSTGLLAARPLPAAGLVTRLSAAPLADGRLGVILAMADGSVHVRDALAGDQIHPPTEPGPSPVTAIAHAVTPDGRTLMATARSAGGVRIWDLETAATLAVVTAPGQILDLDLAVDDLDVVLVVVGAGMLTARWPAADLR